MQDDSESCCSCLILSTTNLGIPLPYWEVRSSNQASVHECSAVQPGNECTIRRLTVSFSVALLELKERTNTVVVD